MNTETMRGKTQKWKIVESSSQEIDLHSKNETIYSSGLLTGVNYKDKRNGRKNSQSLNPSKGWDFSTSWLFYITRTWRSLNTSRKPSPHSYFSDFKFWLNHLISLLSCVFSGLEQILTPSRLNFSPASTSHSLENHTPHLASSPTMTFSPSLQFSLGICLKHAPLYYLKENKENLTPFV